ncbi:pre-mRNA-splicing factor CDC5/CEF1 [Fistulifera solaris]|uniref:Pre-mRNA-splicing factor CDC5/CEF1 n=1 Tax=Fistulifera solaris TaxID=1519565 RepID=A0A1Z5JG16_FISSO|nr:pre-mRNA-splicing factor CDC5/CEF1 [Fistulifera solaris]|eukprot:GAX12929.1 pre-mRNA-splicing factor CDC5/CEF1 [Fistulifera solaris]
MVRVQLKGGVWKNSEDEILKAAVQKYGKQQWARVASLLNRKTAKQAKARWHEWLDPSIKKTEWTRTEDEKLLHLAKLMPAQWKTIAPLVGRTATQCQEHYEELLDQAATGNSAADVRQQQQLRPGQIDSHPETKPARPDPIDMDEDEMEMLQEARARLANTQGKKAKRKERERMLAQAKRLADLQKRRELKQAGLLSSQPKRKKRSRDIDLGAEIPFYKPAAAGFHDTTSEAARSEALRQKRLKAVNFHQVNENIYRTRDKAAAAAQKREEARMRVLEETNAKYEQQAKKLEEDIESQRRPRGMLQLPQPTMTDTELAQMAKVLTAEQEASLVADSGSGATLALLGDYTDRPLPTPMRTPATARRDLVQEASQLRKLSQAQTPLLPGQETEFEDDEDLADDMDQKLAALPTPAMPDRRGVGATPLTRRDELGLNLPSDAASASGGTFATSHYSIRELARQERRMLKKARMELEAALAALPAPQYEYELAVPTTVEEGEEMEGVVTLPDQADVEAAEQEARRLEAERKFRERSTVLQRTDLPRPTTHVMQAIQESEAMTLVREEMLRLIQHDAYMYPMDAKSHEKEDSKLKKKKGLTPTPLPPTTPVVLEKLSDSQIQQAKSFLQRESELLVDERVLNVIRDGKAENRQDAIEVLQRETSHAYSNRGSDFNFRLSHDFADASSESKCIENLSREFDILQSATEALAKKNAKLASKLEVMNGGYSKRSKEFADEFLETFGRFQDAAIEESVYGLLESIETAAAIKRIEKLKEEVAALKARESELQKRYGELAIERRRCVVANKQV